VYNGLKLKMGNINLAVPVLDFVLNLCVQAPLFMS